MFVTVEGTGYYNLWINVLYLRSDTAFFPSEWKARMPVKVLKKDNRLEYNNWRGISVLPACVSCLPEIKRERNLKLTILFLLVCNDIYHGALYRKRGEFQWTMTSFLKYHHYADEIDLQRRKQQRRTEYKCQQSLDFLFDCSIHSSSLH